jgi:hypothetical protein
VFIAQEYEPTRLLDQRPSIARVAAASSANPSADNRCVADCSPRSVHDTGKVINPDTPPEQTNTRSAPRAFA